MNRLFVRIWLANWLVFVIVVFSAVLVFDKLREHNMAQRINNPVMRSQALIKDLHKSVAEGEAPGNWVKRVSQERQKVFLIDPEGQDIVGRRLPEQVLRRLNRGDKVARSRAREVRLEGYPLYRLETSRNSSRRQFRLLSSLVFIGMGFLASGLAAVLLARYISLPIKQLYLASESVASGDFKTNVSAAVGQRKDEIADLARHFDVMANALDKSNKRQQDLLRDVSHEFRSPLTRLLLITDLLKSAEGGEQQKLQLRLKKDLGELETLVDEVMTLARFESESDRLKLEEMDLTAALLPLFEDAKFEANALNKSVEFRFAETPCNVAIAPLVLCRAVENIVRNAIRHTRENTAVLAEVTMENGKAVLCISDHGDGVEDAELAKLFSPFYRSNSARARFKGAGIGLALAERIIKSHGGEISAKNLPGAGGLQVRIELPTVTV